MAKSAFGALVAEMFAKYEEAQARARLDDEHEEARMEFAGAYEAMVAGVGSEAAACPHCGETEAQVRARHAITEEE